jgi:hypothetical protein
MRARKEPKNAEGRERGERREERGRKEGKVEFTCFC